MYYFIDLQIAGNGWGGIGGIQNDEEVNQRFIIPTIPKNTIMKHCIVLFFLIVGVLTSCQSKSEKDLRSDRIKKTQNNHRIEPVAPPKVVADTFVETQPIYNANAPLYTVYKVVDGDTFWLEGNGVNEKIRLIGIDAPESRNTGKKVKQYFGEEAKYYLTDFLLNKKVSIELDVQQRDRYGRLLAYAYTEDGIFINLWLVQNGYAVASTYPPNVKYQEVFYQAQIKAREEQKGLWK